MIDWDILQKRDFERDPDDPGKFERYQAEALIYQHCPVKALLGMICHNEIVETSIKGMLNDSGLDLPIYTRPRWYF